MIRWLNDAGPVAWLLIAGAVLTVFAPRTRWQKCAAIVGVLLIVVGMEASRFDGEPHLTEKLDVTTLFWARAVTLRAVTGGVALALAAPIGLVASAYVSGPRAAAGGVLVLGPLALGLLISAARLIVALQGAPLQSQPVATMRTGIGQWEWILLRGMVLSFVIAGLVSYRLFQRASREVGGAATPTSS